MEEYILFNGNIDGVHRQVRIYPNEPLADQYSIHWDGFEVGIIKKVDGKWFTASVPIINAVNEIGAYIDKQKNGQVRSFEIEGKIFTIFTSLEKGRYDIEWDGLRIGYVRSSTKSENDGVIIWSGSVSLLNLHAQTIGQFIQDNHL